MERGKFITLEGGEGAGKSTQARMLKERLESFGYNLLLTREPGGTPIGEGLRNIVKHSTEILSPETELLIFEASRSHLVQQVITPAINAGYWVISDRFYDSSTVYQGYARGLDLQKIQMLHDFTVGDCIPDATILFDLPIEVGFQRAGMRGKGTDRFEAEAREFHEKVRNGFLDLAQKNPNRFYVTDATQTPEIVHSDIVSHLSKKFGILI